MTQFKPTEKKQLTSEDFDSSDLTFEQPTLSLDSTYASYPGQPKINRIIEGKTKAFLIAGAKVQKAKRTVIISDWSLSPALESPLASSCQQMIADLLQAGFQVKKWNGNRLISIERETAALIDFSDIRAASDKHVAVALAEENIPVDAMLHLDYFKLRHFLREHGLMTDNQHNKEYASNVLNVTDLPLWKKLPEDIYHWLKSKKFTLYLDYSTDKFIRDSPEQTLPLCELLIKLLPENITSADIRHAQRLSDNPTLFEKIISLPELESLVWDENLYLAVVWPSWENIDVSRISVSKKIKRLSLSSEIPAALLQKILDANRMLQSISLTHCYHSEDLIPSENSHYPLLEVIELRCSELNPDFLYAMIAHAHQLKKILIHQDGSLEKKYDITIANDQQRQHLNVSSFKHLKSIWIMEVAGTCDLLNIIGRTAEALENLQLYDCLGLERWALTAATQTLRNLKFISLTKINPPRETITALLQQPINLQGICLNDYPETLTPEYIPDHINFLDVLVIDFVNKKRYKTPLSPEKNRVTLAIPLASYLKIASNLIKCGIDIADLKNLDDPIHQLDPQFMQTLKLDHVDFIDAHNTHLPSNTLLEFLIACPRIDYLNIENCQNLSTLDHTLIPSDLIFTNLDTIDADGCNLPRETLAKIIAQSPLLNNPHPSNSPQIETPGTNQLTNQRHDAPTPDLPALNQASPTASSERTAPVDTHHTPQTTSSIATNPEHQAKPLKAPKIQPKKTITDQEITDSRDLTLNAKELFIPKQHPSTYRINVYDELHVTDSEMTLITNEPPALVIVPVTQSKAPLLDTFKKLHAKKSAKIKHAFSQLEIDMTDEWQPLPSLTPNETMTHLHCHPMIPCDIAYSTKTNLYHVRRKTSKKSGPQSAVTAVSLTFILTIPLQSIKQDFPRELQQLIDYCASFPDCDPQRKLQLKEHASPTDVIEARYQQRIGSCLERSIVLFYKAQRLFNSHSQYNHYQTRVICNGIHAFVEIHNGHGWHQFNIGGYTTQLTIESIKTPELEKIANETIQLKSPVINQTAAAVTAPVLPIADSEPMALAAIPPLKKTVITEADFSHEFATWNIITKKPDTAEALFLEATQPCQKTLIKLDDPNHCLSVIALFSAIHKRPYFLIDTPDDCQLTSNGLKHNPLTQGLIVQEKYSRLRDFLETKPDGILFINWSNFNNTELAALHSILDRELDGETLPQALPLIGFYSDNLPDPYTGADFYKRFDEVYHWAFNLDVDPYHHLAHRLEEASSEADFICDLFESDDWEALLLGTIFINDNGFSLLEHDVLKMISDENNPLTHLHLKNAPWHLREFKLFWQSALQQGWFSIYGKLFTLSPQFKLSYSSSYAWKTQHIQPHSEAHKSLYYPLNMHTFHEFFTGCFYKQGKLCVEPGLFAKHQGTTMSLTLTELLNKSHWNRLLENAHQYKVKLELHAPEGTAYLPAELRACPITPYRIISSTLSEPKELALLDEAPFAIITCNNNIMEPLANALQTRYPNALPVTLDSTHDFGDLFYQLLPSLTKNGLSTQFIKSDVLKALTHNQSVIIHGTLSDALMKALSPLFLSGKPELIIQGGITSFSGKLIFVTDSLVPYCPYQFTINTSCDYQSLLSLTPKSDPVISDDTGLSAPPPMPIIDNNLDDLSLETCAAYETRRFLNIQAGFNKSSIIFYCGDTGVAKTTYFLNEFQHDYLERTGRRVKLYISEKEIESFALHNSQLENKDADAVLFIDEANLSNQRLSYLRAMKCANPHLLINGRYYKIAKNQFVALVGNPKAFGGARQQQEFFDRYAETITCERPNHAYLYHRILKKQLLKKLTAKGNIEAIARTLLYLFDLINTYSQRDLIFSPRQLHMMAVLFNAYYSQFSSLNVEPTHLAISATLTILGDGLTKYQKSDLLKSIQEKFNHVPQRFIDQQSNIMEEKLKTLTTLNDFTFPKSRYPLLQTLDVFLSLRHDDNFHFGVILTGSSAVGKSTITENYLRLLQIDYIKLSFSNNIESTEKLLLNAFHQGQFVILDEINAGGPKFERLLNTLMMGKDVLGQPPRKRGFMIIGTQNPIKNQGRQVLSPAARARFTVLRVSRYRTSELIVILVNKGVPLTTAKSLVKQYQLSQAYAKKHNKSPKPNIRNLCKAAGIPTEALALSKASEDKLIIPSDSTLTTDVLDSDSDELIQTFLDEDHDTKALIQPIPVYNDDLKRSLDGPEPALDLFSSLMATIDTISDENMKSQLKAHCSSLNEQLMQLDNHGYQSDILIATKNFILNRNPNSPNFKSSATEYASLMNKVPGKPSLAKKIAGSLSIIAGILLLAAGSTLSIFSFGLATPIALPLISGAGVTAIATGVTLATGTLSLGLGSTLCFFGKRRSIAKEMNTISEVIHGHQV